MRTMRAMRLGQHDRMHLPKAVCGWRDAVAHRSAMAVMSARQPVQVSETQAVRKREPHVTPHIALVVAYRAAMRSPMLRVMWWMWGSSISWLVAWNVGEVRRPKLTRDTPWCRKSRRGAKRSKMAPLTMAMGTAMRGDHGGRGGQ